MRIFLIFSAILVWLQTSKPVVYNIDIYDSDYALSNNLRYRLSNDSLTVSKISFRKPDSIIYLIKRKLSNKEQNYNDRFINNFAFSKLKNRYVNPVINDGDQKTVIISINGVEKKIEVANVYIKQIATLIDFVNMNLSKNLRMHYQKR